MSACSNPVMRKTNLAVWRAWRRLKLSLHHCAVRASSGPGPLEGSEEVPCGSAAKPPHTPVMLKEVLHYLDVQPAQVRLHLSYLLKFFNIRKKVDARLFKCSRSNINSDQLSAVGKYSNKSNYVVLLVFFF